MSTTKDLDSFRKLLKQQHLSQCAEEYLECLADPIAAPIGCLPAGQVSVPSRKVKYWAQGTMQTNASGNGFILVRPGMMVANDDQNVTTGAIRYTQSAFAGTVISNDTTTVGVTNAASNSEFQRANFNNASASTGLQYRLVSCGIEIENVTPWSTRGGTVAGVCDQAHDSLNGLNITSFCNKDEAFREGVSSAGEARFQLKYNGPATPDELDFVTYVSTNDSNCRDFMCMFITGASSIQTFSWRVAAHFEIIGFQARGKTVTWPDPHGASLVQCILAKAHNESSQCHHDSPTWWQQLGHSLVSGVKAVASGVDKLHIVKRVAVDALESVVPGSAAVIDGATIAAKAGYDVYKAGRNVYDNYQATHARIAPRPRAAPKARKPKAKKPSASVFKPKRR